MKWSNLHRWTWQKCSYDLSRTCRASTLWHLSWVTPLMWYQACRLWRKERYWRLHTKFKILQYTYTKIFSRLRSWYSKIRKQYDRRLLKIMLKPRCECVAFHERKRIEDVKRGWTSIVYRTYESWNYTWIYWLFDLKWCWSPC